MNSELLEQVLNLSVAERIELAEAIWDSVEDEPRVLPLSAAQTELLQQRLAAYDADPTAGSSWDEVRARLQRLS